MKQRVKERIEKVFRPEFLNRVDDVIVFRHLTIDDLKHVIDIELSQGSRAPGRTRPEAGADRRGQEVPHQEGLEHRFRRTAASPGDRELRRRSALRGTAQGRVPGKDTITVDTKEVGGKKQLYFVGSVGEPAEAATVGAGTAADDSASEPASTT